MAISVSGRRKEKYFTHVVELERCAKMGLRGAMVSISQQSGESYGDAKFDRFWAAAEALEIPVSLHVAASETNFTNTGDIFADFSCGFTPTMYTVATMIGLRWCAARSSP